MLESSEVSFENLYGVNNRYPQIETSTSAVRCLKCYEAIIVSPLDKNALTPLSDNIEPKRKVYPNYDLCKCGNVGAILDAQSTLRVYTEDIRTVHLGSAITNAMGDVLKYYWAPYSENHVYTDYASVKDSGVTFVPKATDKTTFGNKKLMVTKKEKKQKINDLVESLDLSAKATGRLFFYDTKE